MAKKRMSSKGLNVEKQAELIGKVASGTSKKQTAKDMGISRTTVQRYTKKPEIKKLIEEVGSQLMVDHLGTTKELIADTLDTSSSLGILNIDKGGNMLGIDKDKLDLRKLALKTGDRIQQAAGIMPSNATPLIQNILIQGDANILTPTVQGILDKHLEDLVIDVECED
jgi:DNA-binding transcriptional MocR family regulator